MTPVSHSLLLYLPEGILFNTTCLVYVNSQEIYKLRIYRSILIYLSSVVYNSIFYYMLP